MFYGLIAIVLLLSLPSCGWLRKSDQSCGDVSCQQEMPAMEEEVVETTETMVPDNTTMPEEMPAEGSDMGGSEDMK